MLKVIVSIRTELVAAYMPFSPPKMRCTLVEYPYKPSLQDRHGRRHSLRQTDAMANLNFL